MGKLVGLWACAAAIVPMGAWAQETPTPGSTGPLGGWHGASSNPGSGAGEMPGSLAGVRHVENAPGIPKGAYGLNLSNRIADARKLVDEVARGRVLTPRDARRIRDLMREDFVAWSKQYDLLPSAYRAERARWLLDEQALSPAQWAQQRLDWLNAQRDWILARGG